MTQSSHHIKITFREKLRCIIFEADTTPGKVFDILLIASIILSIIIVMLDSVDSLKEDIGFYLQIFEWFFTIVFTIEYILRLYCVHRPLKICP